MPYSRLSTGARAPGGVDGVGPLFLEPVGADLVCEADAATLVAPEVDEHATALLGDEVEGGVQLGTAVAAQRPEDVTGQALRVHAHQHVVVAGYVAHHEGEVLLTVEDRLVNVGGELRPSVGMRAWAHAPDELLVAAPGSGSGRRSR